MMARMAGMDRLFCSRHLWVSAEPCKIRNPRTHRLGVGGPGFLAACAIIFRETMFRGMDVPSSITESDALARPPWRHRPQGLEITPGRRPHDQCGAVTPGRHLGAALPAPGARAGGGRLHQGLPRAARREEARL